MVLSLCQNTAVSILCVGLFEVIIKSALNLGDLGVMLMHSISTMDINIFPEAFIAI